MQFGSIKGDSCECANPSKGGYEWLGDTAWLLNVIAVIPQLYHVYTKRDARSLSYLWILTSLTANVFWFAFGVTKNVPVLQRKGLFFACFYFALGIMKYLFN